MQYIGFDHDNGTDECAWLGLDGSYMMPSLNPIQWNNASRRSYKPISYAILVAGLGHIIVFALLHLWLEKQTGVYTAVLPSLNIRLSRVEIGSIARAERPQSLPPATKSRLDNESTKANTAPTQKKSIVATPAIKPERSTQTHASPPSKSVLQQYLDSGELPQSVIERLPGMRTEPVEDLSQATIFHPLLRQQVRRAQARRKASGRPSQQNYTLGSGDQFERQDDKCFVGRNMLSEEGVNRVWYPTKCPASSTARAFGRRFNSSD